eukprot:TRINITY_DN7004_c0_g4_i1.p1 TRINITY_DN7004_c0_g4~~TRINITY_DN7004_c0_g4_i1.p1  ORF type:complete len:429 (-),score=129.60 TRINITY_DN7004_c0_g4_i1:118-1404(-)
MPENGAVKGAIKVKDGLYVGDERAAVTFAKYRDHLKVTHIVNCAHEYIENFAEFAEGVEYLGFDWVNDGYATILDDDDINAEQLFAFIEEGLNAGGCVLVHSTSQDPHALIVIASYLMRKFGWNWRKTKFFLEDINLNMRRVGHFFVNQLTNYERRLEAGGLDAEVADEADGSNDDVKEEETLLENTLLNARTRKQGQEEEAPLALNRSTTKVTLCEDFDYIEYEYIEVILYGENEHEEETEAIDEEELEGDEKEVERLAVDKKDTSSGDEQVAELLKDATTSAEGGTTDEARVTPFRQLPSVGSWLPARPSYATAVQVAAPLVKEKDAEANAEEEEEEEKARVTPIHQLPSVGSWLSARPNYATAVQANKEEEEEEEKAMKRRKDSTTTAGSASEEDIQSVYENAERIDEFPWWQGLASWFCLGRGM